MDLDGEGEEAARRVAAARASAGAERYKSLYLCGRMRTGEVKALVDTGATVSLLAKRLSPPTLKPYFGAPLHGPSGEELHVMGTVRMEVDFEGHHVKKRFVVVPQITEDAILGTDFLAKHVRELSLAEGTLTWASPADGAPAYCSLRAARVGRVCAQPRLVVRKHTQVPPRSVAAVPVQGVGLASGKAVEVAPTRRITDRTSVILPAGRHYLRQVDRLWVVNVSDDTVMVTPHTVLAVCTTPQPSVAAELPTADEPPGPAVSDAVVGEGLTAEQTATLREVLREFEDVFAPRSGMVPVTSHVTHHIDTTGRPVACRPRRLSPAAAAVITEQVEAMRLAGVVRPSASPWASPVVLVTKKDGSVRFCVDYRALNARTRKDTYPLPRVDDTLQALVGAVVFTVMDMAKGYWQIPLAAEDAEKTAFVTPDGLFEFTVMPFGLCNAPATFQRFMDHLVSRLRTPCVLAYMDDVIVFSRRQEDHVGHVRAVLQLLRDVGMAAKATKCQFAMKAVEFLGHRVDRAGYLPLADRTAALTALPDPDGVPALRRFLGFMGYYRGFVPHFSTIAAPLTRLLKKGTPWAWGPEQRRAKEALAKHLAHAPTLAYPRPGQPFRIYTDASDVGLGAIAAQVGGDGVERPVAFLSRTLKDAETRYSATERECLAVVFACRSLRHWILGTPCTLFTDHAALRWLATSSKATTTARLARWLAELQEFSLRVEHRPGRLMEHADALSRAPLLGAPAAGHVRADWTEVHASSAQDRRLPKPLGLVFESGPVGTTRTPGERVAAVGLGGLAADGEEEDIERLQVQPLQPQPARADQRSSWRVDLAADPDCREVIDYLEARARGEAPPKPLGITRRELEKFTWDGDTLTRAAGAGERPTIVVPRARVRDVLTECHGSTTGAHVGPRKTEQRVGAHYYWAAWRNDVRAFVLGCPACQSTGPRPDHREGPMGSLASAEPWELMAMDMVGPLEEDPGGPLRPRTTPRATGGPNG